MKGSMNNINLKVEALTDTLAQMVETTIPRRWIFNDKPVWWTEALERKKHLMDEYRKKGPISDRIMKTKPSKIG